MAFGFALMEDDPWTVCLPAEVSRRGSGVSPSGHRYAVHQDPFGCASHHTINHVLPLPLHLHQWRGFFMPNSFQPMQEMTSNQPHPNASEEVLIDRAITFRNSTFGALKHFMRDHTRRTGQTLTNSAAVDMVLRAHLSRHLHRDVVAAMHRQTAPRSAEALRSLSDDCRDVAPLTGPRPPVSSAARIGVDMNAPRRRVIGLHRAPPPEVNAPCLSKATFDMCDSAHRAKPSFDS